MPDIRALSGGATAISLASSQPLCGLDEEPVVPCTLILTSLLEDLDNLLLGALSCKDAGGLSGGVCFCGLRQSPGPETESDWLRRRVWSLLTLRLRNGFGF